MNPYQHTQPGILVWISVGLPTAILLASPIFATAQVRTPLVIGGFVLLAALVLFHSLTVSIDEKCLRVKFGIGLIRATIQLSEISKASQVRNKWYYGWGFRILENGYLYNVSGLDAVEIELASGAVHRIGTDEPIKLFEVLNKVISSRHP